MAYCLAAFSAGLVFNGAMLMLNRGFFSLQENWIPTVVALGNLALNIVLDTVFYRVGAWGIPLATAVVNIFGTAALLFLMRRRIGGIEGRKTLSVVVRVAIASAAVAAVAYFVWEPLDSALGRTIPAQTVSLTAALLAAAAVYLGSLPAAAGARARRAARARRPARGLRLDVARRSPPAWERSVRRRPRWPWSSARRGCR